MYTILSIAAGGAIGAVLRHGVNVAAAHWFGMAFPWGTLIVNVAGSFAMGLLIAVFAHFWEPPQVLKLFLVTGLLGALTTFSTFSLDVSVLFEHHKYGLTLAYILSSVCLSVGALFAALYLVRSFVS